MSYLFGFEWLARKERLLQGSHNLLNKDPKLSSPVESGRIVAHQNEHFSNENNRSK